MYFNIYIYRWSLIRIPRNNNTLKIQRIKRCIKKYEALASNRQNLQKLDQLAKPFFSFLKKNICVLTRYYVFIQMYIFFYNFAALRENYFQYFNIKIQYSFILNVQIQSSYTMYTCSQIQEGSTTQDYSDYCCTFVCE